MKKSTSKTKVKTSSKEGQATFSHLNNNIEREVFTPCCPPTVYSMEYLDSLLSNWFKPVKFNPEKRNIWSVLPIIHGVPVVMVYRDNNLTEIISPTLDIPWAMLPKPKPFTFKGPSCVNFTLKPQYPVTEYVFGFFTVEKSHLVDLKDKQDIVTNMVLKGSSLVKFVAYYKVAHLSGYGTEKMQCISYSLHSQLVSLQTIGLKTVNSVESSGEKTKEKGTLTYSGIARTLSINLQLLKELPNHGYIDVIHERVGALRRTLKHHYLWSVRYYCLIPAQEGITRFISLPPITE